jgi:hypothetical protein
MVQNKSEFLSLDNILGQAGIGNNSTTSLGNSQIQVPISSQIRKPKEVVLISLSDWTTGRLITLEPKVRPLECRCFFYNKEYDRNNIYPEVMQSLQENLIPFAKNYYKKNPEVEQAYIFPEPWCKQFIFDSISVFNENWSGSIIFPDLIVGGKSDFELPTDTIYNVRQDIKLFLSTNLSEIINKRVLFLPFFIKKDADLLGMEVRNGEVTSTTKNFYKLFSTYDHGDDIAKLMPVLQQSLWHSSY